jgi:hypothetical protein
MGTGTLCGYFLPEDQESHDSEIKQQNIGLYQTAVFKSVIELLGEICRMMLL